MTPPHTRTLSSTTRRASQAAAIFRAVTVSCLLGGNIATLGLLRRPTAAIGYVQYALFAWRMLRGSGLPQRQFHELLPTPDCVSVDLLPTTGCLTWWDANYAKDILYLALLARVLEPKTIFEIGTLHGYTALLFALNSPPDACTWTLDLPRDPSSQPALSTTMVDDAHIQSARSASYVYLTHPQGSKVRQLYGDSARFDFSPYQQDVDLFFIDGAHSYEYVRSDTQKALACVRPGGVVVWHDYGRWGVNGVSRWLHELSLTGKPICRLPGSSLAILRVPGSADDC